jgi:uncharacterized cupredoxin-like copper-binding protein
MLKPILYYSPRTQGKNIKKGKNMKFENKNRIRQMLSVLVLLLAFIVASCSANNGNNNSVGNGSVPQTGGNGQSVNVKMTTYKFQVDKPNIPSGPVTFHVTNTAEEQEHEMVLLKTDLPGNQLPTNDQGLVDEEKLQSKGEVEVGQGETKDLSVDLTPGHYVLLCNEPGHYKNNMFLDITVD